MGRQRLKDTAGREYSASFMDPPLFGDVVNSINPGLQVSVKLAFDVPPATKPTQIVLHESLSSHGVPVKLTRRRHPHLNPHRHPHLPRAANDLYGDDRGVGGRGTPRELPPTADCRL